MQRCYVSLIILLKSIIGIFFFSHITYAGESVPFYQWLAKSQTIPNNNFLLRESHPPSRFINIERIASATPMLKFYADALHKNNLPLEFVILPLIESGNNPQARSPKNALGLWQFIPSTANEWGLQRTAFIDERSDVQKSTFVAIRYLKFLYTQFNDWNLVLAAYNWGPNRVKHTLYKGLKNKKGQINFNLLPKETQQYIINFHAFNQLIRLQYKKKPLSLYPNIPYLVPIKKNELTAYLSSSSNMKNLDSSVLFHINGFHQHQLKQADHTILVPTPTFATFFDTSKISFKVQKITYVDVLSCGEKMYETTHDETMESIADKFHLSLSRLHEYNPSIRFIRPGMLLRLC